MVHETTRCAVPSDARTGILEVLAARFLNMRMRGALRYANWRLEELARVTSREPRVKKTRVRAISRKVLGVAKWRLVVGACRVAVSLVVVLLDLLVHLPMPRFS